MMYGRSPHAHESNTPRRARGTPAATRRVRMSPVFEESLEGFISRWRPYAAPARLFGRAEGSPLVECRVGGTILQLLERTNPYLGAPGPASAIINPSTSRVELTSGPPGVEVTGISRAHMRGTVELREDPFLVVDVGFPVVLGVTGPIPAGVVPGATVGFEAEPPIHGFVLAEPADRSTVVTKADRA